MATVIGRDGQSWARANFGKNALPTRPAPVASP
jgi:hypothetical protein